MIIHRAPQRGAELRAERPRSGMEGAECPGKRGGRNAREKGGVECPHSPCPFPVAFRPSLSAGKSPLAIPGDSSPPFARACRLSLSPGIPPLPFPSTPSLAILRNFAPPFPRAFRPFVSLGIPFFPSVPPFPTQVFCPSLYTGIPPLPYLGIPPLPFLGIPPLSFPGLPPLAGHNFFRLLQPFEIIQFGRSCCLLVLFFLALIGCAKRGCYTHRTTPIVVEHTRELPPRPCLCFFYPLQGLAGVGSGKFFRAVGQKIPDTCALNGMKFEPHFETRPLLRPIPPPPPPLFRLPLCCVAIGWIAIWEWHYQRVNGSVGKFERRRRAHP